MPTSESQARTLAMLPKTTGAISIVGSSLIALSVLRSPEKMAKSYHRLLLGMSLVDMLVSLWEALSTWPMPADSGAMFAFGNSMTCNMQGFFIQIYIVSSFYSVSLAIYYTVVLRYDWSEERVRRLEPYLHSVPLLWGVGTGIIGISLKLYNPAGLWCWIAPWPVGCVGEECIRGANANMYRWLFFYGPLWINIAFVTTAMFMVWFDVRRRGYVGPSSSKGVLHMSTSGTNSFGRTSGTIRTMMLSMSHKTDKTEPQPNFNEEENADDIDDNNQNDAYLLDHKAAERARLTRKIKRDVAFQGFLYSGSFYVTWIWLTSVRFLQLLGKPVPYNLMATAAFFAPLQGFFNMLVYMFPKFMAVKKAHPEDGILMWIHDSIF